MQMDECSAFDWIDFPEGRARFVGLVRGVDERGHEAFALEIDSDLLFGEIRSRFLDNHNDFNVEIVSFGLRDSGSIGEAPFDPREILSIAKAETARQLILRLVRAGMAMRERPSLLVEYQNSSFMGKVVFRDDWVRLGLGDGRQ